MPGFTSRTTDMNGYNDFERGHLRSSSYQQNGGIDPYRRDEFYSPRKLQGSVYGQSELQTARSELTTPRFQDYNTSTARSDFQPYREDPYDYNRVVRSNGYGNDIDQGSLDGRDMRDEPTFEVDHLATYSSKTGVMHAEDGLRKLRQMENTTGIWTMRCLLTVERKNLIVIDKGNGEELERFPIQLVHEPTAIFKDDRREIYTNLILFTILEDPRKRNSQADMHIFQSIVVPAQEIVDEVLAAKEGRGKLMSGQRIPPPPSHSAPEPPRGYDGSRWLGRTGGKSHFSYSTTGHNISNTSGNYASNYAYPNRDGLGKANLTKFNSLQRPKKQREYNTLSNLNDHFGSSYSTTGNIRRLREFSSTSNLHNDGGNFTGTYSRDGFGSYNRDGNFSTLNRDGNFSTLNRDGNFSTLNRDGNFSTLNRDGNFSTLNREGNYSTLNRDDNYQTLDREGNYSTAERQYNMRMRPISSGFRASHIQRSDDLDAGQNEALERDVQLLNCCFDDIEKFVSRLQQAAEAYRELEKRKRERSANKKKNKQAGDGMLNMRARPPPAEDFVDIFQKFKFAFNLLSKLKAHIHDPNAPELVHFLFTPLSLIYEASRDPVHNNADLADRALAPLVTNDAKQLLLNCLTSKELELWQQLGKSWTTSREEYRGYVDPYNPRFYNGWTPSPQNDDSRSGIEHAVSNHMKQIEGRNRDELARSQAAGMVLPFPSQNDDRFPTRERDDFRDYSRSKRPSTPPPSGAVPNPNVSRYQEHVERHIDRNKHAHDDFHPPPPRNRAEENFQFGLDLKRMGATIYEAIHERQGKNAKELTVEKGDVVQVMDSSRNWWKLKNFKGEVGYAPYTILKECTIRDDDRFDMDRNDQRGVRNSGDYNSYIPDHPNHNIPAPPPVPPGGVKPGRRDDYEDRKYSDRQMGRRDEHKEQRNGRKEQTNQRFRKDSGSSADNDRREDFQHRKERSPAYGRHDNSFDKWSDRSNNSGDISREAKFDERHNDNRDRKDERRKGPSPPPPPPPELRPPSARKTTPEKRSTQQSDLHSELVKRVSSHQNISKAKQGVTVYISRNSGPDEVSDWLETKGFSDRCISILDGYTGEEMFQMHRKEMERLLGKDEAQRLDSQLLVQKNISGFGTRGASELRAILQERKKKADTSSREDNNMGKPPSFTPSTPPDYSDSNSDTSSDDFANAGKTLRHLLQQQRRRIHNYNYDQPSS